MLYASEHPLVRLKVAELRDVQTRPPRFRELVREIALLLGALLALVAPAYRPAVLPFLVAFVLIAVSAMLVGDVPRYRYPVDPLMYVMAAGGLFGSLSIVAGLIRRRDTARASPVDLAQPTLSRAQAPEIGRVGG